MGCSSSTESEPHQAKPQEKKSPAGGNAGGNGGGSGKATERTASQVKVDARLQLIQPNDEIGRLLKNVPLLSKLSDAERAKLGGAVTEKNYQASQRIITQGEPGTGFFIIRKGTVAVSRVDEQGRKQELATLKEGDFFGQRGEEREGGDRDGGESVL